MSGGKNCLSGGKNGWVVVGANHLRPVWAEPANSLNGCFLCCLDDRVFVRRWSLPFRRVSRGILSKRTTCSWLAQLGVAALSGSAGHAASARLTRLISKSKWMFVLWRPLPTLSCTLHSRTLTLPGLKLGHSMENLHRVSSHGTSETHYTMLGEHGTFVSQATCTCMFVVHVL